jgi:hypothetical protein
MQYTEKFVDKVGAILLGKINEDRSLTDEYKTVRGMDIESCLCSFEDNNASLNCIGKMCMTNGISSVLLRESMSEARELLKE